MATAEIDQLRDLADIAEDEYTDLELQTLIDERGSVDAAARRIWQIKAAKSATLTDISESGSTRAMSQLHKQALTMADAFQETVAETVTKVKRSRPAGRR